tara:strand:+ start:306 stop:1259 length:954 start_codon:yes stop_codon:yes gene_type:complete
MNKIDILSIPIESNILITGHINPDGDALGSGLALKILFDDLGYNSVISYDMAKDIPRNLKFLPVDTIENANNIKDFYDISFVFDCGDPSRLGKLEDTVIKSDSIYVIDHHIELKFGTHAEVDPDAASTTQVLYRIFKRENIEINSSIASCLLTGLITDTGRFQYSNTTPEVFLIAADLLSLGADIAIIAESIYGSVLFNALKLQAEVIGRITLDDITNMSYAYVNQSDYLEFNIPEEETDFLIDVVRLPEESDVALLAKEQKDNTFKVSLRSRRDVDVQRIAQLFGGGGHRAAAGFNSDLDFDEIVNKVKNAIRSKS